jgi:hypothetical protein
LSASRAKDDFNGALEAKHEIGLIPDDVDKRAPEHREDGKRGIKNLVECVGTMPDAPGTAKRHPRPSPEVRSSSRISARGSRSLFSRARADQMRNSLRKTRCAV